MGRALSLTCTVQLFPCTWGNGHQIDISDYIDSQMCVFIPHLIPDTLRLTNSGLVVRTGTDKVSVEADEIIILKQSY